MRPTWVLILSAAALAQPVTVGVRGGVRPGSEIQSGATSESRPYLVGPMVEVRLPHRFGLEADALYSRFGYTGTETLSFRRDPFTKQPLTDFVIERVRANSWEFPLMAKYRFAGPVHILAGYAARHLSGRFEDSGYSEISSSGQIAPLAASGPASFSTNHALVVGAGVAWRAGPVRFEPELRYLRWKNSVGSLSGDQAFAVAASQYEVQILVGIGWGGR